MCELFCVSNRRLCGENFFSRMENLAKAHPAGIFLREKDLSCEEYFPLARRVGGICQCHGVPLFLHTFADVALRLGVENLHLPLPVLRNLPKEKRAAFRQLGSSCHSVGEAMEAVELGCTYLICGHIFPTQCKAGLAARGLAFLAEVCERVPIPVYAIGGIDAQNFASVCGAGAKGACIMSSAMTCPDPSSYIQSFKESCS